MKVLHLLGATEDNGGILSTIRGLSSTGPQFGTTHCVWVNDAYQETRAPSLDYRRCPQALDESHNHLELAWRGWRAARHLADTLQREPFDILHAHSRGAFAVAAFLTRRLPRTVVFTNHTYARRRGLYQWGARQPRWITVLLTRNMGRHYGLTQPSDRLHFIPECCPDSFFTKPLTSPRSPSSRVIRLIGVGNWVRWKKWDLLLRALAALPADLRKRFQFTLWGPTPAEPDARTYSAELQALQESLALQDIVTLNGPSRRIPELLSDSDWFVLPSTNEPCSVALLEALCHGIPALVSNSGGNVDIVTPGVNGLHFDADSIESLTKQLVDIATDAAPIRPPVEIRESVRSYSATHVAGAYDQLYRPLIRTPASPGG